MRSRLWTLGGVVALLGLVAGAPLHAAPAAAAQDIRDIHGPIAAPARRPLWPWLAGGGIVAAVAAGWGLSRRRRTRPLAPADRALQALAEARALTQLDARGFSFAVSEIVRVYVEEAFALRAAHRTTEELLGDLMGDASPVAAHRAELGDFLRYCDLAKFAGWSLSRDGDDVAAGQRRGVRARHLRPAAARRCAAPSRPRRT